jgi:hypothetical protein
VGGPAPEKEDKKVHTHLASQLVLRSFFSPLFETNSVNTLQRLNATNFGSKFKSKNRTNIDEQLETSVIDNQISHVVCLCLREVWECDEDYKETKMSPAFGFLTARRFDRSSLFLR